MSADEFDPFVERLFDRAPQFPDAELFSEAVQQRLASHNRVRALALAVAGLVGGVVAVRESFTLDLPILQSAVTGRALTQGVQAASGVMESGAASVMTQMGLSGLEFGSMGGMQLFWITAGAAFALLAAGVVKLSQES